jgi:hypothetical protein
MSGPRFIYSLIFGLLLVLPLLVGCSSFRTDIGESLSTKSSNFIEHRTTVAGVMDELGAPDTIGKLPNGFAFLYEYSQMDEFQFGFSLDLPIIRYLKFVHAFNHMDHQVLLLTFNESGILQSSGWSQWKEHLGGGNGVQIVVAMISLSDSSVYLRPADAQSWGKALLQPTKIVLNSANNLRTGVNGLQQHSVPDYAGQETLEMAVPKSEKEKRLPKSMS